MLLLNKMASRRMKLHQDESFNIDFSNNKAQPLGLDAKVFASLSMEVLKSHEVRHESLQQHVRNSECNLTLRDIINLHTRAKEKNSRIYKVKQR